MSSTDTAVAFVKVEGLGNDFLLLDHRADDPAELAAAFQRLAKAAPQLCDRRRGVGADGLLIMAAPAHPETDATMIVINHDGSRPQMCGNGLRCVALQLALELDRETVVVATDAGLRPCKITRSPCESAQVEVHMGSGIDTGPVAPAAGGGREFARVSMGNPHAIAFVEADEDPRQLAHTLGPAVEVDVAFPERTNVEFARIEPDGAITLWVWERGVGITLACGTGACATAYAAARAGRGGFDVPIVVHLPGGALTIVVPDDRAAAVRMRGPARAVFRGTLTLADA